ncbi:MAG TPA: hypothetical protein VNX02_06435 [Steroidobacteraceae bacterium]|jgi:hypothetical protein|nr:hypothetical protein [Steroidobacteraceae bacterium]
MLRLAVAFGSLLLLLVSATPAGAAAPEAVTLSYAPCGGMICVPVTLADGKSHVMLLDTGNVNSWLLVDTARALGLKVEPIEQDGKTLAGLFRLGPQTVSLGSRTLSGRFLALDREQTGELPAGVEGALAYTLFKDKVVQIDFAHRTLRLLEPQPASSPDPGSELQLITFGKQGPPVVVGRGFSVNGKTVSAQIDTCYTGTLLVYTDAIGALGLQRAASQGRARYFPYTDGGVDMNEATTDSVAFGAYVLSPQPAIVYFPGNGGNPVHQPDGLFEATVGNALFAHSVVTLDFHAMRFTVQPG